MSVRKLSFALFFSLIAMPAPGLAVPQAQVSEETVSIPFDPPIGQSVSYRWEKTDEREGRADLSWSVNRFRFEEAEDGYRIIVEPVSWGFNETDPIKLSIMNKLAELTDLPFVLRTNQDVEIVELEDQDKYWAKVFAAVRESLAEGNVTPEQRQAMSVVTDVLEKSPRDVRLAQLIESIQPLVEFALTEPSLGTPISVQVDTQSPLGGTVKQDRTISLAKVDKGFAHLTVRASVPREEMEKATSALLETVGKPFAKDADFAKMKAQLSAFKEFKSETIADYKVSLESGMLESFKATRTISVVDSNKSNKRTISTSLTRVD